MNDDIYWAYKRQSNITLRLMKVALIMWWLHIVSLPRKKLEHLLRKAIFSADFFKLAQKNLVTRPYVIGGRKEFSY